MNKPCRACATIARAIRLGTKARPRSAHTCAKRKKRKIVHEKKSKRCQVPQCGQRQQYYRTSAGQWLCLYCTARFLPHGRPITANATRLKKIFGEIIAVKMKYGLPCDGWTEAVELE